MAFDPITAIFNVGNTLIEKLIPDVNAQAAAKEKLTEMQINGELAQVAAETDLVKAQVGVDLAEAQNPNVFVAGWRPFIGWVCGSALAANYMVFPLMTWVTGLFGHEVRPPALQLGDLISLVMGMLGFGALRSWDKKNGTGNGA